MANAAVELIDGVDYADVLLISWSDTFRSVAATGQVAIDLDDVQHRFQEGQCWMRPSKTW